MARRKFRREFKVEAVEPVADSKRQEGYIGSGRRQLAFSPCALAPSLSFQKPFAPRSHHATCPARPPSGWIPCDSDGPDGASVTPRQSAVGLSVAAQGRDLHGQPSTATIAS